MQQWRWLDSEPADAYTNMALDEALLLAQAQGGINTPTLRFYSWRPAAISLGYAQKIEEVVNREACRRGGVDIVRRITGGRAVYHQLELTYCLVVRADNPLFAANIGESYATIGRGLVAGLRLLGVEAELAGYSRPARTRQNKGASPFGLRPLKNACFLAPSRHEIMAGGKKLLGSAQRRLKGVILQQGSLPLQMDDGFDYWQLSAAQRASLKSQWGQQTAALWDLTGPLSLEIIKQGLIKGFEQALPIKLVLDELTTREKQLAKDLLAKYQSFQWNEQRAGK